MKALIPRLVALMATCILMLYVNKGQAAQITTTPSEIAIGGSAPTPQLRIECRPSAFGITAVFALEIGKKLIFGGNSPVVSIDNIGSVHVHDASLLPRMTQSGSISGTSGDLQMTLRDLTCLDAANTYYCATAYNSPTGVHMDEATANVTISRGEDDEMPGNC